MTTELTIDPAVALAVASVRERIAAACDRAGRAPSGVTLVAASKTRPPEAVLAAMAAGVMDFGENRVEDAAPKIEAVARLAEAAGHALPTWHMIGHLQSRKAKLAVGPYALLHSVDSARLAAKLEQLAADRGLALDVLLEVNLGGEDSKFGFPPPEDDGQPAGALRQAVDEVLELRHIRILGLMGMAPIGDDPEAARPHFRRLRLLRDALRRQYGGDWSHLSIGMTDDFEVAVEEGATLVRVGRALFGPREAG